MVELERELGHAPTEEQIADRMGISTEEYARIVSDMWDAEVTGGGQVASSAIEVSSHVPTTAHVASLLALEHDEEGGSLAGSSHTERR